MNFFGEIFFYDSEVVMLECVYNESCNCKFVENCSVDFYFMFYFVWCVVKYSYYVIKKKCVKGLYKVKCNGVC